MSEEDIFSQSISHAWKIYGCRVISWTTSASGHLISIEPKDTFRMRCPSCSSTDVVRAGVVTRQLATLPIGQQPVTIRLTIQRLRCRACGKVRQGGPRLAVPRRSYTFAFENYVTALARCMTIQDVARHLHTGWDVIKSIVKRDLSRRYARPALKHIRWLGIDELHVGKMGQFITIVMDWESGQVVHVGDGRGGDALKKFWQRLRASQAKIEAVCTDMSPAYAAAVAEHLPGAVHVYDRFHIVKLMNEKLAQLRRQVQRHTPLEKDQKLLKGTLWLLIKSPEKLSDSRHERQRLEQALAIAYYLKEELRQLWNEPTKTQARQYLEAWIARAQASQIPLLMRLANTITGRLRGILAWYDFPISNGPLEGTNNKIQLMKRQAYGYRDKEFFYLKIKAIHEARYALVG